jgi:hypothetical protein
MTLLGPIPASPVAGLAGGVGLLLAGGLRRANALQRGSRRGFIFGGCCARAALSIHRMGSLTYFKFSSEIRAFSGAPALHRTAPSKPVPRASQ